MSGVIPLRVWAAFAFLLGFVCYKANAQVWGAGSVTSGGIPCYLSVSGANAVVTSSGGSPGSFAANIAGSYTLTGTTGGFYTYTQGAVGTFPRIIFTIGQLTAGLGAASQSGSQLNFFGTYSGTGPLGRPAEPVRTPAPDATPLPDPKTPGDFDPLKDILVSGTAFTSSPEIKGAVITLYINGQEFDSYYSQTGYYEFLVPEGLAGGSMETKVTGVEHAPLEATGEPVMVASDIGLHSGTLPGGAASVTNLGGPQTLTTLGRNKVTSVTSTGERREWGIYKDTSIVGTSTNTIYTYANPSGGGSVTYNYSGAGTTAATTDDIRRLQSQLSGNDERVIGLLDEIRVNTFQTSQRVQEGLENDENTQGILRDGFGDVVSAIEAQGSGTGSPNPTPAPTPGDSPLPFPTAEAAAGVYDSLFGNAPTLDGVDAPAPSDVPAVGSGGGSSFWSVEIPGFGSINFDPTQDSRVSALANWMKIFLTWLATLWFLREMANLYWQLVTESNKAPQTLIPSIEGSALGFGGNFGPLIGPFIVLALGAAVIGGTTAWSTYVNGIEPLTGGSIGVAGSNLFASRGTTSFDSAMQLCLWFLPVHHFLTVSVNWFAAYAAGTIFYQALSTVKRFFFGGA